MSDWPKDRALGWVYNCVIQVREGEEFPFYHPPGSPDGTTIAMLDSYAIIPLEEYERLKRGGVQ